MISHKIMLILGLLMAIPTSMMAEPKETNIEQTQKSKKNDSILDLTHDYIVPAGIGLVLLACFGLLEVDIPLEDRFVCVMAIPGLTDLPS